MNSIPKKSSARPRKKAKSPTAAADLRPVIAERQSVMILGAERLPDVVVPLPQVLLVDCPIPQAAPEAC
jgi:hypothetical protein